MSYNPDVRTQMEQVEYQKFVEIQNDSRFPPISVIRTEYADSSTAAVTSLSIYPKTAVLTYLANASDINISLSSSNLDIGDVGLIDHYSYGNPIHGSLVYTTTVTNGGLSYDMGAVLVKAFGVTPVSGIVTVTNPTTAVYINGTAAISGSVTVTNPTSAVIVTNTVAISTAQTIPVTVTNTITATVDTNKGFPITYADSANLDAFGRLRVSFPTTLFDSKTLHNKSSLFWSQTAVGAGADVRFTSESADASVTLSAAGVGQYAIRQTTQRFNYQPGKSQLGMFTGLLTPVSNAIKRIGLFQSLTAAPYDPNVGLYFETQTDATSSIAVVQQNNGFVVPSVSARRENWNIDKLDGTGPSGKTLNLNGCNIFLIDYEWLGVGRVRYGFVIDGIICYVHQINNAGNVQGAYLRTPNLPVRAEVRQAGAGTASMKLICCSVMSEGGADFTGVTRAVDTGITPITVTTQYNRRALIGVRLQSIKLDSVNEILNAGLVVIPQGNATDASYRYELVHNPTLGGSAVTWNNVDVNSNFDYAVVPDNTVTVTGGTVIASGFGNRNSQIDLTSNRFEKFLRLGCSITGDRDQVWLVYTPLDNKSGEQYASITFIESD